MELREPKDLIITQDGKEYCFILSKFPAVQGREIVTKYPTSSLPKIGDYSVSEETMLKLMAFVGVKTPNGVLRLQTRELVDNHVVGWEVLAKIEMAMMEYNCSFFGDGTALSFLENAAQGLIRKITEILTNSSVPSSTAVKPPSTNSEPSTL